MNIATNKLLPALLLLCLMSCMVLLPACREKPPLTDEEQEYLEEAMATADEMFELRRVADMPEETREVLKDMYLETGYNRAGTKVVAVHYVPLRIKQAQKFLGGVVSAELERSRVRIRNNSVEVELRYAVTGKKRNTREWVTLRERPESEEWMTDNGGFIITSHQIKM